RRADGLGGEGELVEGRSEDAAAVHPHVGGDARLVGVLEVVRAEVGDAVPGQVGRLTGFQAELLAVPVRVAGGEGHGDDDHAQVHEHAAVGSAQQAVYALAPGGQHQL